MPIPKPSCTGLGVDGDHCCYVRGKECPNLVRNKGGRAFACNLMIEHGGDWSKCEADPRYKPIGEVWESIDLPFDYCRRFNPIFCCREELRQGERSHNDPLYIKRFGEVKDH